MTRPILLPLLVVSALASSGCEKTASPIGPGPPPSSQLGSGALSLEGPSSVAPGRTAAFRLLLSSLGTSQDVSSRALWSTSEPSILDVTTPGTVVGRTRGEAIIQTRYQGVTTSASVYVLEDGTFKLAGRVLDGTVGLPGARLQITTGMGAGLEATSDGLGRYAIYGVAGGITIETMLTEYATVTRAVMVANHAALDVPLEPSGGRRQLAGRWTLSISASPACTDVPPDARLRTYEVETE